MMVQRYRHRVSRVVIEVGPESTFQPDDQWLPVLVESTSERVVDEVPPVVEVEKPTTGEGDLGGKPSKAWTVKALKAYAEKQGLDVAAFTRKDDILAALT